MSFLGRAKYNLLQYKCKEGSLADVPEWQIRDYRALNEDELVFGLKDLGVDLDKIALKCFAESGKAPEEIDFQIAPVKRDEAYLYTFELWRRNFAQCKSISIFCDELDAFINRYDLGKNNQDETLLIELFDILDESVDAGMKPKIAFKQLTAYLAHDLESFFYNYIYDQIDMNEETRASELLESIYDYIEGSLWFEFLRIRLLCGATSDEATAMMARFLEKLTAKTEIELSFEVLYYLIETGRKALFINTYKVILKHIKNEDHFLEMLEIIFAYYSLNDLEHEENLIRDLIAERKKLPSHQKVTPTDKQLLSDLI